MSKNYWIILMICFSRILAASSEFDHYFLPKTFRLDYFHTGNDHSEIFSFDEVYQEQVWAGSVTRLIDDSNLGKYCFQVFDVKTGTLIYSRGFCSVFGEWQTTDQAKEINRTFSESIRFPWPKASVNVTISERDSLNRFIKVWEIKLDPDEVNFRRSVQFSHAGVTPLILNGDPNNKIDIVILPDGYTKEQMEKFHLDAVRMLDVLFSVEPFSSNRKKFNVRAVDVPSNESGIDNPQKAVYRDNALGCSFNAFGSDRYILTWENKILRKSASRAPYDHIYILVNSDKYGGGGIFNLYSTCASDNQWSDYIFVHEFGHSFGGLADEYYTSDTAYNDFYPAGVEPWEPNITSTLDRKHVKWHDLIDKDIPVPTPWNKAEFDSVQSQYREKRRQLEDTHEPKTTIDSLIAGNGQWVHDFLRKQIYWGKVGMFEGGGYSSQDIYRPFIDCRMFTRSRTGFDPVCSRAIEKMIQFYSE